LCSWREERRGEGRRHILLPAAHCNHDITHITGMCKNSTSGSSRQAGRSESPPPRSRSWFQIYMRACRQAHQSMGFMQRIQRSAVWCEHYTPSVVSRIVVQRPSATDLTPNGGQA
jgi:hypothetical protein